MDDEPDRAGATAAEFASNASTLVDSSVTETELDDALADVVVQAADADDGSPSSSTGGGAEKSDEDCADDDADDHGQEIYGLLRCSPWGF